MILAIFFVVVELFCRPSTTEHYNKQFVNKGFLLAQLMNDGKFIDVKAKTANQSAQSSRSNDDTQSQINENMQFLLLR